jgi:hypothetical protein
MRGSSRSDPLEMRNAHAATIVLKGSVAGADVDSEPDDWDDDMMAGPSLERF